MRSGTVGISAKFWLAYAKAALLALLLTKSQVNRVHENKPFNPNSHLLFLLDQTVSPRVFIRSGRASVHEKAVVAT